MSWELGSRAGVVDAMDARGHPMPVALPSMAGADLFVESEFAVAPRLTFQPLVDAAHWHPAIHTSIGFWLGVAATLAVMWWRR